MRSLLHTHTYQVYQPLGVNFQFWIYFMSLYLSYVFFHNFPNMLNMEKNLNTVAPGSGYPVVSCAIKQETKTMEQVHRVGIT